MQFRLVDLDLMHLGGTTVALFHERTNLPTGPRV